MGNPVLSSSDSSRSSHVSRSSHSCCDPKSRQLQWAAGTAASPPGAGAGNGAALRDGGRRACASPAHLCLWKGVIVKLYQELVVAEVLQRWRCVVILNVPAAAQCSCEVVALAVASSGCTFQRNPSDLAVWAFRKGIKKNSWQSFCCFSLDNVKFSLNNFYCSSCQCLLKIVGRRKVHVLCMSVYAFCILLPGLVCGILSFITSQCWHVCAASLNSADACWLHHMFPKIQTWEQQDSSKISIKRKQWQCA